ncbi:hypothetical protein PT276_01650 [Orbaceae bacterium ESL0721]|nr:hypothetical protein [Orbaceae bacterium ESL0721]
MRILFKAYYKTIGGELVTPSKYREKNPGDQKEHPAICVSCNGSVFAYGVNSKTVTECFKHYKTPDKSALRCPLHSSSNRYNFLSTAPLDKDAGQLLREKLFTKESLLHSYQLFHKIKSESGESFTDEDFIKIIESTDAIEIYNYKSLELWGLIILLLLQTNFKLADGTEYYYKLKRNQKRQNVDDSWWSGAILKPSILKTAEEINEDQIKSIPFSEAWLLDQIASSVIKERDAEKIFAHFNVKN